MFNNLKTVTWFFNVYMDSVMVVNIGMGKRGVRFQEGGKSGYFLTLCMQMTVLYSKLEEDLRLMVGYFVEVCRRGGLKVNAGKSKVIMLGGEEGLECEVCVDGICLEYVSEFKYLGCVLDESGTDEAEYSRKRVAASRYY